MTVFKERLSSREQEINGRWLTEDRLKRCGEWSASAIKSMINYCKRYPDTLVRKGRVVQRISGFRVYMFNLRIIQSEHGNVLDYCVLIFLHISFYI